MFSLQKIRTGVYHLYFDNIIDLCFSFLRYQEFYESPSENICGKSFTIAEFVIQYMRARDTNVLTYCEDWTGFNIPLNIIKEVNDSGIKDPNQYDHFMLGIYDLISIDTFDQPAYLIGTTKENLDQEHTEEQMILNHELTHAMFHLNNEYQSSVKKRINAVKPDCYSELSNALKIFYNSRVHVDEINAYITTSECGYFDNVKSVNELNKLRTDLKKLHKKHFNNWLKDEKRTRRNI